MTLSAQAYLVRGGAGAIAGVQALLEKEGIEIERNPDIYTRAYTAFVMDDARELRERASLRSVGKHGRTFVIYAPTIPADAQNVLLKILEEPPAGARFYIIVPSPETLLPTLRSRMQTLELAHDGHRKSIIDAKAFLAAGNKTRLDMLKPLLEKDDDDRRDLAGTITFLGELEKALSCDVGLRQSHIEGIRAVYRARKYITDRGAIVKSLLEQMALLV